MLGKLPVNLWFSKLQVNFFSLPIINLPVLIWIITGKLMVGQITSTILIGETNGNFFF